MNTIPASKLETGVEVFLKIVTSPTHYQVIPVKLLERTFTTSLKDMKPDDKIVLLDTETESDIEVVRHHKVPQLVLKGTNKRVSFVEIDEDSKKMKADADKLQSLMAEEAEAAEKKRAIIEKLAKERRQRVPGSTVGLGRVDKLKHRASTFGKRITTINEDLKKASDNFADMQKALREHNIEATLNSETGEVTFAEIPEADVPETEVSDTEAPATEAGATDDFEVDVPA